MLARGKLTSLQTYKCAYGVVRSSLAGLIAECIPGRGVCVSIHPCIAFRQAVQQRGQITGTVTYSVSQSLEWLGLVHFSPEAIALMQAQTSSMVYANKEVSCGFFVNK